MKEAEKAMPENDFNCFVRRCFCSANQDSHKDYISLLLDEKLCDLNSTIHCDMPRPIFCAIGHGPVGNLTIFEDYLRAGAPVTLKSDKI